MVGVQCSRIMAGSEQTLSTRPACYEASACYQYVKPQLRPFPPSRSHAPRCLLPPFFTIIALKSALVQRTENRGEIGRQRTENGTQKEPSSLRPPRFGASAVLLDLASGDKESTVCASLDLSCLPANLFQSAQQTTAISHEPFRSARIWDEAACRRRSPAGIARRTEARRSAPLCEALSKSCGRDKCRDTALAKTARRGDGQA